MIGQNQIDCGHDCRQWDSEDLVASIGEPLADRWRAHGSGKIVHPTTGEIRSTDEMIEEGGKPPLSPRPDHRSLRASRSSASGPHLRLVLWRTWRGRVVRWGGVSIIAAAIHRRNPAPSLRCALPHRRRWPASRTSPWSARVQELFEARQFQG